MDSENPFLDRSISQANFIVILIEYRTSPWGSRRNMAFIIVTVCLKLYFSFMKYTSGVQISFSMIDDSETFLV